MWIIFCTFPALQNCLSCCGSAFQHSMDRAVSMFMKYFRHLSLLLAFWSHLLPMSQLVNFWNFKSFIVCDQSSDVCTYNVSKSIYFFKKYQSRLCKEQSFVIFSEVIVRPFFIYGCYICNISTPTDIKGIHFYCVY